MFDNLLKRTEMFWILAESAIICISKYVKYRICDVHVKDLKCLRPSNKALVEHADHAFVFAYQKPSREHSLTPSRTSSTCHTFFLHWALIYEISPHLPQCVLCISAQNKTAIKATWCSLSTTREEPQGAFAFRAFIMNMTLPIGSSLETVQTTVLFRLGALLTSN